MTLDNYVNVGMLEAVSEMDMLRKKMGAKENKHVMPMIELNGLRL